jgi:hypothetical protein
MRTLKDSKAVLLVVLSLFLSCSVPAQETLEVLDVSGQWTLRFNGVEYGCQNPLENGPKEGVFVFQVTQQGDNLTATFKDGKTVNRLIGVLKGTVVTATVHGVYPENCKVVTDLVGKVVGKGIKGTYSGRELNCETCIWEGEFTVEIGP